MMEKMKMSTPDLTDMNIAKIGALFPNVITETRDENGDIKKAVDFDLLRQALSKSLVEDENERYRLDWPGKKASLLKANTPITKTLRPCREESVNFETTENLYIEGDNFEVLKILQESYLGKIKMIYIDPPYNTGNDFIYRDNFSKNKDEYEQDLGLTDEEGGKLFRNTDANGRYHSDWLSMMYERLLVARDLLRDDGVIFISIDDNEIDNLKKICSEIFGENNFIGCAGRITKKSNNKGEFWAPNFDYLLTYTKSIENADEFFGGCNYKAYNLIEEAGPRKGEKYQLVRLFMSTIQNRNPEQRFWIDCPDGTKIIPPGKTFPPQRPLLGDGIWRWTRSKFEAEKDKIVIKQVRSSNLLNENKEPAKWNVFTKTYLQDVIDNSTAKPNSFIENHINQLGSHELSELGIPFDYSKPSSLIKYLAEVCKTRSNDIILDFFSGSATTAHAVMQLNAEDGGNRKFIMVQLPEPCDENSEAFKAGYKNIAEIGKERIRRAGKKIVEELKKKNQQLELGEEPVDLNELDIGFRVYKTDTSNLKDVFYHPSELDQGMLSSLESNIKEDRTPEDLLTQVLLDLGLELTLPIETKQMFGNTVYIVQTNALIACFDENVDFRIVDQIADLKPLRVVFKDASFINDKDRINVEERFKRLSPETKATVI